MSKKRVNFIIDSDLNDRWAVVAKKIKMSRTAMLESMLENSLPMLEYEKPTDAVSALFGEMSKVTKDIGNLFDNKQYYEDIEEYKKKKRG